MQDFEYIKIVPYERLSGFVESFLLYANHTDEDKEVMSFLARCRIAARIQRDRFWKKMDERKQQLFELIYSPGGKALSSTLLTATKNSNS